MGTWPNGYLVFLSPVVLGSVSIVQFWNVGFPGGLGTHSARYPLSRCRSKVITGLKQSKWQQNQQQQRQQEQHLHHGDCSRALAAIAEVPDIASAWVKLIGPTWGAARVIARARTTLLTTTWRQQTHQQHHECDQSYINPEAVVLWMEC